MHKGSCLCGSIRFEVSGTLPPPSACHCNQCRKHSGHFEVSTDVPRTSVEIYGEKKISWFHSKKARRGFCSVCGSSLFWDPLDQDKHKWIALAMGAFDTSTDTELSKHIFIANKGDYYEITDGLPQNQQ